MAWVVVNDNLVGRVGFGVVARGGNSIYKVGTGVPRPKFGHRQGD